MFRGFAITNGAVNRTTAFLPLPGSISPGRRRWPDRRRASKLEELITDFGLARRLLEDSRLTASGAILGTPSYMAPEQAAGKHREVSVAADIYSLGAILYELLAAHPPFQGDSSIETLRQVMEAEPRCPSSWNRNVPPDLEAICLKCLEKSPPRRYASAGALRDDFLRCLAGKPVLARRLSTLGRSWRWCNRNPAAVAILALLCFMALGASLAALWQLEARREAEIARGDAREKLRHSLLAQAQSKRRTKQDGRRGECLKALSEAAVIRPGIDLRNEAIASLALPDFDKWLSGGKYEDHFDSYYPLPRVLFSGISPRELRYSQRFPVGSCRNSAATANVSA